MLNGTYEGRPVHAFRIDGKVYCVLRDCFFGAIWNKQNDIITVFAPAGMSYHQAALEAAAGMERGAYI